MDRNKKIGAIALTLVTIGAIVGIIIGTIMTSRNFRNEANIADNGKSLSILDNKTLVQSSSSEKVLKGTEDTSSKQLLTTLPKLESPKVTVSTTGTKPNQINVNRRKLLPKTESKTSKKPLIKKGAKTTIKPSPETKSKTSKQPLPKTKSKTSKKPLPETKTETVEKPSTKTNSKSTKSLLTKNGSKKPLPDKSSKNSDKYLVKTIPKIAKAKITKTKTKRPTTTTLTPVKADDCFRYKLTSKKMNFWQARYQCKAWGGDIVSNNLAPSGQKFHSDIKSALSAQKYTWIWVGVRRRGDHLKFLDDVRIPDNLMFPWAGGEPNGWEDKQNCVTVNFHYEWDWKLYDDDCNGSQYGLCEMRC